MKIYTKKGDKGTTGLIGGTRLPKHHIRIEAYGTVDELNSYIGLLRDLSVNEAAIATLLEIQDRLFTLGSLLASDPEKSKMELPQIGEKDIEFLESEIDRMDATLPPMRSFVLPGGHPTVSHTHIARCICRRAERLVTQLSETEKTDPLILAYLNRLSDYLFMLSRFLSAELGAAEQPWQPRIG
jgi:cob(I)alamin adenosyltransferase